MALMKKLKLKVVKNSIRKTFESANPGKIFAFDISAINSMIFASILVGIAIK